MVVGKDRSSEKEYLTHLEVLVELVPQGPEVLGRKFQAKHRRVLLCLVLRQTQHLKDIY